MLLLLPIKWLILQCLIFLVMVAIEAAVLHFIEGIAKRDSMIYLFLVNLFSFNFGWLLVTLAFYFVTGSNFQDDILGYMLLGIVSEKLLVTLFVNPFSNPLLLAMVLYFGAVCYFELKMLTLLKVFVLPTGEKKEEEEIDLKLSPWADRLLVIFLSKDFRLVVTVFIANFVSHTVVGGLIFLTQA
ncbi:hypothetical protein Lepto7376_2121 [[Leptolyngbya] sp. PCC 7376]|uniref:hypothetical protein n=1 Tax=[Leptolyngbya] sp. PCC 7376 TaxID=111781 RepID=UPI00029F04C9|nr:hypothetical protein [[Leptolyngbya] sp. PCC 7376]AFY38419.1 hypothetical protein Lepto7376_2121 [[Leptolyngbya] sp. PCC 7376]